MNKILTFRRQVTVPLTRVCANRCTYCTYVDGDVTVLSPSGIRAALLKAKKQACFNILFKSGENVDQDLRVELALRKYGYESFVAYLVSACRLAIAEGLLPAVNVGGLKRSELAKLKPYISYLEFPLETISPRMSKKGMPHFACPGKKPEARIKVLKAAGSLRIPVTTGILVGMGETRKERYQALEMLLQLHKRYGHIQEVFIRPCHTPNVREGAFRADPAGDASAMVDTVRYARAILGDIPVQVPLLRGAAYYGELLEVGVSDLGVMPVTGNGTTLEKPWPSLRSLRANLARLSFTLEEEQALRAPFLRGDWFSEELAPIVRKRCAIPAEQ